VFRSNFSPVIDKIVSSLLFFSPKQRTSLRYGFNLSQIAHNVLALGAVADFGAQNCQYTTKVDAR